MNPSLLLAALCIVAAIRPLWGFAAIFVLTASLFNLHRYVTVELPMGYLEPAEAILAVILARAALVWALPPGARGRAIAANKATDSAVDPMLAAAIVPYCAWQALCTVLGAIDWAGTDYFRFTLRYQLSAVLPWAALLALRTFRKDVPKLFSLLFHIALVTAIVHIVIQVLDLRQIMQSAYWDDSVSGEFSFVLRDRMTWVAREEFVRALPQGLHIMLFCAVFDFAAFLTRGASAWRLLRGCVLSAGLLITITRSIAASLVGGILLAALLHLLAGRRSLRLLARAPALVLLLALSVLAYDQARPGFIDQWWKRAAALSGSDTEIFSEANLGRGLDNLASLAVIRDHPVLGIGTPRYPIEYSLRRVPPTDIHPLLLIGLVGGVPAILLALNLQLLPILHFTRRMRDGTAPMSILPHTAALATSALLLNTLGGGGTLGGSGIFLVCVFLAAAAHHLDAYASAATFALPIKRPIRIATKEVRDYA